MPATTTIRVPGVPEPLEFGDFTHDRVWSTSQLATTQATTVNILSAAPSEVKPGATATLTERESNVPAGGQRGFPSGYEMYVYSIQIVFGSATGPKYNSAIPAASSPTDASLLSIYSRAFLSFRVQSKLKSSGPLYKYPSGGGLFFTGFDNTNATNRLYSNNGMPSPREQAAFIIPHHLEPNIPFAGSIGVDAALALGAVTDLEGHMEGLIKRPVV